LASIIALGLFILFILSLWKLPAWQVTGATLTDKERLELMDKARGTLAQIWAGVGIALGLYFTWRRIAAAERTVHVAEEGQITERFTRAIDQLGATDEHGRKRLELRLGGIYALERIARDSEKDYWPIMEVLTAYVREHASWKKESSPSPQDLPQDSEEPASEEDNSQQRDLQSRPRLDTDIQAILTVIGRRTRRYGQGEDQRLDLRGTDLRGANLIGAHLERAILSDAHLEGADLIGAHLERANLNDAHLEGAILIGAHLEGANLNGTHLEGANLSDAHGLTRGELAYAYTDENTLLPDYLTSSQADDEDA
jgi:hypothetical protein